MRLMSLEGDIREALDRGQVEAAATATIRGYGPPVLGYLTRVLGSADDAADAFSLFSEQLWKGMGRFEGRSTIRVWAYRIAWSAAMRVLSQDWRRRRERLRTSMASRLAAEVQSRAAGEPAPVDELDALRGALSPDERALLVLRIDQRLSWREVAEILGAEGAAVDEAVLRKRFERLKEKLGQLARQRGIMD